MSLEQIFEISQPAHQDPRQVGPDLGASEELLQGAVHEDRAAEVSAVAGYSWLMAHSTGALQHAVAQPFQDELGHLSKFWGFYREAFPEENTATTLAGVTRSLAGMAVQNSKELSASGDLKGDRVGMGLAFGQVLASTVHWDATRRAEFR